MDCFDRDGEAEKLWRYFKNGRNVLMLAPRRMGKTVLLERLKDEGERHGFRAILLDVEGYRQEKDFFQQMCAAIQEELGVGQTIMASFTQRLRNLLQGAESVQGDWRNLLLQMDWRLFADQLVAQLEKDTDDKTWVFLVDEITIFTKALLDGLGVTAASDFLYKLRQLCQRHRKVRWLFTGSIGLDTIARRHGFEGALVDLEIFSLEPFSRETARGFLDQIAKKNRVILTEEAVSTLCDRLGWLSPYYLEKLGEAACERASSSKVGRRRGTPGGRFADRSGLPNVLVDLARASGQELPGAGADPSVHGPGRSLPRPGRRKRRHAPPRAEPGRWRAAAGNLSPEPPGHPGGRRLSDRKCRSHPLPFPHEPAARVVAALRRATARGGLGPWLGRSTSPSTIRTSWRTKSFWPVSSPGRI